jgi:hypothetical protein
MLIHNDGLVYAAGLVQWVWEEGRGRGQWLLRPEFENATHPVRLNVYSLVSDTEHPAYRKELIARWQEQHPNADPATATPAELEQQKFKYALQLERSFDYPGWCTWPLMALTNDGRAIVGCYDQDSLYVLRLSTAQAHTAQTTAQDMPMGAAAAAQLLEAAETEFVLKNPFGITALGAIAMDPSGEGFILLDRATKRVISVPYPFNPDGPIAGAGLAMDSKTVTIIWP